ncbi:hypothetical protein TH59_15200 [Pantoea ananatis]|uniref:Uncharacterized protein n=1 Tax=Pantoea ananas TaxID=553 RepID=A0A8A4K9L4_PANAN|nr:hypothetical protein [Pantoea ananatis]OWY78655.1 hypothetical protein CDN97_02525 [Pantoea sp. AMG 501]PKC29788.1 hypothetical protein V462_21795 [Pantoea ananatis 15320]PKC40690.1 hypothetical protein V461_20570 [Pantoea ananatis BRT98]CCF09512.1 hypothetical protein PANA5342_2119 [Pantoea ananatis LMG 5342]AMB75973.1 hypothetical protein AW734_14995 [Pantoea ananatis]
MWANALCHKHTMTTRQHRLSGYKAKEPVAKAEKVSIPESWDLNEHQRNFIESFLDPKVK